MKIASVKNISICLCLLSMFLVTTVCLAATHTVKLEDKQFVYQDKAAEKMVIKKGDTVIFKNTDTADYDISSSSKAKTFKTGVIKPGAEKSIVFGSVGEVEVECAIHTEMFLDIQVQ